MEEINKVESIEGEVDIEIIDESDFIGKEVEDIKKVEDDKGDVEIESKAESNEIGNDEDKNKGIVVKREVNNVEVYIGIVEGVRDFDIEVEMILVLIVVVINSNVGKEVKEFDSFSLSNIVVKEMGIDVFIVDIEFSDDKGNVVSVEFIPKMKSSISILVLQVSDIFNKFNSFSESLAHNLSIE